MSKKPISNETMRSRKPLTRVSYENILDKHTKEISELTMGLAGQRNLILQNSSEIQYARIHAEVLPLEKQINDLAEILELNAVDLADKLHKLEDKVDEHEKYNTKMFVTHDEVMVMLEKKKFKLPSLRIPKAESVLNYLLYLIALSTGVLILLAMATAGYQLVQTFK